MSAGLVPLDDHGAGAQRADLQIQINMNIIKYFYGKCGFFSLLLPERSWARIRVLLGNGGK